MVAAVEGGLVVAEKQQQILTSPGISPLVQFMEVAKVFAASDLVPANYRNKPANCLIALEMANRIGVSAISVMQGLYVVNGRPSWSGQYIIAAVNSCGRFTPMQFEISGEGSAKQCVAWATTKDGTRVESPAVTMAMAMAEGWVQKTGSKWKTMPDLMLRYRAAAFFGRLHCPEILFGMMSEEEAEDVPAPKPARATKQAAAESSAKASENISKDEPEPKAETPLASSNAAAVAETKATPQQVQELLWFKDAFPIKDEDWIKALGKRNVSSVKELSETQAAEMVEALREKSRLKPDVKKAFDDLKASRKKKPSDDVASESKSPEKTVDAPPEKPTTQSADVPFEMTTADPTEADPSNAAIVGKATPQQVEDMVGYRQKLGIPLTAWSEILARKNVVSESDLSVKDADEFLARLVKKYQEKVAKDGLNEFADKVAGTAKN